MHRALVLALLLVACREPSRAIGPGFGGEGGASAGVGGSAGDGGASSSTSSSTSTTVTSTSSTGGSGGAPGPECVVPSDCGGDGECHTRTCDGGVCGVAYAPLGAPAGQQTPGDCYTSACDGAGAITEIYAPSDLVAGDPSCELTAYCTPSGPVHEAKPDGTPCDSTCGCPQHNGGTCGATGISCTQGLCSAGTCVDHLPVTCVTLQYKNGVNTYTRCDLTAGQFSISWGAGTPECQQPGWCVCSLLASDIGYCAPGTTCYVSDANGVWLGPQQGTGTCQ